MQIGIRALNHVAGLTFYKLLGSGAKNGFSAKPNFGTYALFSVWENETKAQTFFEQNLFYNTYKKRSSEMFTVYLKSAEAHGYWDGVQPFEKNAKLEMDKPIVVLTRASIRLNKLWSFWSKVGIVSQSLEGYKGVLLSIGVGEWPLIQQATISIWKSQAEMIDYAYKNPKHKEVVMLTRKLNWYKEEMFARFVPYKFEGIWDGKNVENFI
jgi:heme-degrading monooxygenase HmoA